MLNQLMVDLRFTAVPLFSNNLGQGVFEDQIDGVGSGGTRALFDQ